MFKNSNQRPISNLAAKVELEKFPPYLVEVDTGEEILMLPEDDRYRGVPASAYDLENQLKEGVELNQCPTYIQLEGVYGADVATRLASKFQNLVEDAKVENERVRILNSSPLSTAGSAPAVAD